MVKEIEKWLDLKEQEKQLVGDIERYSTYKINDISEIIMCLMTIFEGVEFCIDKTNTGYFIKEKEHSSINIQYILSIYKKDYPICLWEEESIEKECKLYPRGYKKNEWRKDPSLSYVQDFIDYLFTKKANEKIETINIMKLQEILNEYLLLTKNQQEERKRNRNIKIKQKKQENEKWDFQRNCMIERIPFYNSIVHLINHYCEEEFLATKEFLEERDLQPERTWLYLYHQLIVQNRQDETILGLHKAFVDSNSAYPDEDRYIFVDKSKNAFICFYDVKREFKKIYDKNEIFKVFINELEMLYNEPKILTCNEIELALINACNANKEYKRTLNLV